MRRISFFVFVILFGLAFTADARKNSLTAKCSGDQEVPPTNSKAKALVKIGVSEVDGGLNYSIHV